MLAFGNHGSVASTFGAPLGTSLSPTLQLLIWAAAASAVVVRARPGCIAPPSRGGTASATSGPHQHNTAMAMAEVLVIGPDEALTPEQVAKGIDDYLYSFTAA